MMMNETRTRISRFADPPACSFLKDNVTCPDVEKLITFDVIAMISR